MKDSPPITGRQINWNQVFYFSEVAAVGSIKHAALKLQISPSTLSEHILQLERDLNIRLFNRLHRKMALTEQGSRLYQYAKQMFETGQRLIDVVSPIPLGCYPISIGMVSSPSIQIGYSLLREYASQFGPLNMRFYHAKHEELEKGLSDARFDFGFSSHYPERKNIVSAQISSSSLGFFIARKLSGIDFKDLLATLPLLICNAEPRLRSVTSQFLAEADITPTATITADYPSLLFDLCQHGLGIGVFNEEALASVGPKQSQEIIIIEGSPKITDRLYVLWSKDGENSEAVKRMTEILSHPSESEI